MPMSRRTVADRVVEDLMTRLAQMTPEEVFSLNAHTQSRQCVIRCLVQGKQNLLSGKDFGIPASETPGPVTPPACGTDDCE